VISYGKQTIDKDDIDAIVEILKGDWLTQGPAVEMFENDLKTYFCADYSCAVANGTAALHLTGLALGWQPGDIVITSPITFLATANCIVYAGATPDFVDIDPISYTMDPNQLEEKVKAYQMRGKKVKAVIGVDYAGNPCDWEALRKIANQYELQLVNDNCHAMGAKYFIDKQYAIKYADVVTQSYHPVKHITTGEGGGILTKHLDLDSKVRLLRSHGMTKDFKKNGRNCGTWYYEMHEVGYNYRITDFQCALGSSQLKKLDHFVEKRQKIAKIYNKAFTNNDLFNCPKVSGNVSHAWHLYPLQIKFDKAGLGKKQFFEEMKNNGINLQVHYIPVHTQPFYHKNYGFNFGDFPVAEEFYQCEVSLPIYPSLNSDSINKVVDSVRSVLNVH